MRTSDKISYEFRVRARNSCGTGEWSDRIGVVFTVPPRPMNPPVLSIDSCSVVFEWEAPLDGGESIT